MTQTINPSAAWTGSFEGPMDGELANAEDVAAPFRALLGNDKYLKALVDGHTSQLTTDEANISKLLAKAYALNRVATFGIPEDLPPETSGCSYGATSDTGVTVAANGYIRKRWSVGAPTISADSYIARVRCRPGGNHTAMPTTAFTLRLQVIDQSSGSLLQDESRYHPATNLATLNSVVGDIQILTNAMSSGVPYLVTATLYGETGSNTQPGQVLSFRLIPQILNWT